MNDGGTISVIPVLLEVRLIDPPEEDAISETVWEMMSDDPVQPVVVNELGELKPSLLARS